MYRKALPSSRRCLIQIMPKTEVTSDGPHVKVFQNYFFTGGEQDGYIPISR